jgi:hypothetical protein
MRILQLNDDDHKYLVPMDAVQSVRGGPRYTPGPKYSAVITFRDPSAAELCLYGENPIKITEWE